MRNNLICTVGTSLLLNLRGLPTEQNYETWLGRQPERDRPSLHWTLIQAIKVAFDRQDWQQAAIHLAELPSSARLGGAEINSITDLIEHGYVQDRCKLFFCHSDTPEGEQVATLLQYYYALQDYPVELSSIVDLQDQEPRRFRTKGLRNLAKDISRIVREYGVIHCAINATGGYKAQIAIGVLIGQALGIPVYYKHELFSEIIAFPPMPVSLDQGLWMQKSGVLTAMDREPVAWSDVEEDWDERLETLVERVDIDGAIYLELAPTGQIFQETFKGRFESDRDQMLPPGIPAAQKVKPLLSDHNWGNARSLILATMQRITDECSYVRGCRTHYWNLNLAKASLFRLKGEDIEGVFSNGSWTVKFIVDTTAKTAGQREACVADLNHRMLQWQ